MGVSKEVGAKLWGIFNTNRFEEGLCIVLARVNHSCDPNAEFVWNKGVGAVEIRAVRKINRGEEVTANYADLRQGLNR